MTAHKISLGCLYHQFDGFQPNCANSGVRTVTYMFSSRRHSIVDLHHYFSRLAGCDLDIGDFEPTPALKVCLCFLSCFYYDAPHHVFVKMLNKSEVSSCQPHACYDASHRSLILTCMPNLLSLLGKTRLDGYN